MLKVNDIAEQALIAPARCCLKNIGEVGASDQKEQARSNATFNLSVEEQVVEEAFDYLKIVSQILRERFSL